MIESLQRALALVCVCITLACTAESDTSSGEALASEPTAEQGNPPVGAWVVIDEGRGLFKTANREAGRIGIESEPQLRVVEVVAHDGDLLEVRTIAGDRGDVCARVVELRPNYQLRFFVEPEAVQQVLIRPVGAEFEDGTSLELAPGVPVIATGTPGKVRLGEAELLVNIGEADVGRWFLPSSVEPTVQPPVEPNSRPGELLTTVNACGRFVLRPESPSPVGILGILAQQDGKFLPSPNSWGDEDDEFVWGDGCSSVVRKALAGTPLSWLNGGTAGTVLVTHEIPRKAKQLDDRFCFDASGLAVCIPAGQLMTETGFDCGLIGLTTDRPPPPNPGARVRLAKAQVGKGLDPDLVRRIVRAHMNEVRSCYNTGLATDPTLAGRVVIAFEVAATGKVASASVKSAKLVPADDRVPVCIAKAFKRWSFPRQANGKTVTVTYPIELSP